MTRRATLVGAYFSLLLVKLQNSTKQVLQTTSNIHYPFDPKLFLRHCRLRLFTAHRFHGLSRSKRLCQGSWPSTTAFFWPTSSRRRKCQANAIGIGSIGLLFQSQSAPWTRGFLLQSLRGLSSIGYKWHRPNGPNGTFLHWDLSAGCQEPTPAALSFRLNPAIVLKDRPTSLYPDTWRSFVGGAEVLFGDRAAGQGVVFSLKVFWWFTAGFTRVASFWLAIATFDLLLLDWQWHFFAETYRGFEG